MTATATRKTIEYHSNALVKDLKEINTKKIFMW